MLALSVVMILLVCSTYSQNVKATGSVTGVYLGSGTAYIGLEEFEMWGYVYYNSNTSSSLDVSSLVEYVFNTGNTELDEFQFTVYETKANYRYDSRYVDTTVSIGGSKRIEKDWSTVTSNTVYNKGSGAVFTQMLAGNSNISTGGWDSIWTASSRQDTFHY